MEGTKHCMQQAINVNMSQKQCFSGSEESKVIIQLFFVRAS